MESSWQFSVFTCPRLQMHTLEFQRLLKQRPQRHHMTKQKAEDTTWSEQCFAQSLSMKRKSKLSYRLLTTFFASNGRMTSWKMVISDNVSYTLPSRVRDLQDSRDTGDTTWRILVVHLATATNWLAFLQGCTGIAFAWGRSKCLLMLTRGLSSQTLGLQSALLLRDVVCVDEFLECVLKQKNTAKSFPSMKTRWNFIIDNFWG